MARVARETRWHPSQLTQRVEDNAVTVTLNVPVTAELVNFILGWGANVEVVEPSSLRQRVAGDASKMVRLYSAERKK
jgi:proteasome accessory factor B